MNCLDNFIQTLEEDFGLMLLTRESVKEGHDETMGGSCPDDISYSVHPFTETTHLVTGFILNHPYGATIRSEFAKPVEACVAKVDQYGAELDFQDHSANLARAILGKLGNIALEPDSELKAYAARA